MPAIKKIPSSYFMVYVKKLLYCCFTQLRRKPTDECWPNCRWKNHSSIPGTTAADGRMAVCQWWGYLQHETLESSEWYHWQKRVVSLKYLLKQRLVHWSISALEDLHLSWSPGGFITKDATCTAGKRWNSVFILLLLIARLLPALTVQLLFQARKTRSSYVKEALKHVKNIQVVPGEVYQGGILSLFLFSKRGSVTESSDNISVPVNDPRRSIHGDVWNRLLVHLYPKLRQISESSYIAAKVIFLNRVYMSLLTHSPLGISPKITFWS